jgi:hypothetical protein
MRADSSRLLQSLPRSPQLPSPSRKKRSGATVETARTCRSCTRMARSSRRLWCMVRADGMRSASGATYTRPAAAAQAGAASVHGRPVEMATDCGGPRGSVRQRPRLRVRRGGPLLGAVAELAVARPGRAASPPVGFRSRLITHGDQQRTRRHRTRSPESPLFFHCREVRRSRSCAGAPSSVSRFRASCPIRGACRAEARVKRVRRRRL